MSDTPGDPDRDPEITLAAGNFRLSQQGIFTAVSNEFLTVTKVDESDFIGKFWVDIVHSADSDRCRAFWGKLVSDGSTGDTIEFRFVSPRSSSFIWFQTTFQPLGSDEEIAGFLVTASDITERKSAETALFNSESRYVLATSEGLFDWDIVNDHMVFSPHAKAIACFNDDDTPITITEFVQRVHPDDAQRLSNAMSGHLLNHAPYDVDYRLMTKQMRYRWFRSRGQAFWDDDGRPTRMFGSLSDVTDRIEMQTQLVAAREEAFKAAKMKEEFLANVSHEVRTPMNGILGMTNLLLETELTLEQRDFAVTVRNCAENLLLLLNDLLDFSKMDCGQLTIEPVAFDLRQLIRDVVLMATPAADKKNITASYRYVAEVPRFVIGDALRIRQVIVNLLGNAVKFTHKGEVKVEVEVAKREGDVVVMLIHVIDTGIGIPQDYLTHIFEKFSQVDTTSTRRFGGTGLGLAISRQLCHLMGGDILVESTVGEGSRFTVSLPMTLAQEREVSKTPTNSASELVGKRVLCVYTEKNKTVASSRLSLAEMITRQKMEVDVVEDVDAAVLKIEEERKVDRPYSFVMADFSLPGAKRLPQAVSALQSSLPEAHGETFVIMMVAPNQRSSSVRCGAHAFVTWPLQKSTVIATMTSLLRGCSLSGITTRAYYRPVCDSMLIPSDISRATGVTDRSAGVSSMSTPSCGSPAPAAFRRGSLGVETDASVSPASDAASRMRSMLDSIAAESSPRTPLNLPLVASLSKGNNPPENESPQAIGGGIGAGMMVQLPEATRPAGSETSNDSPHSPISPRSPRSVSAPEVLMETAEASPGPISVTIPDVSRHESIGSQDSIAGTIGMPTRSASVPSPCVSRSVSRQLGRISNGTNTNGTNSPALSAVASFSGQWPSGLSSFYEAVQQKTGIAPPHGSTPPMASPSLPGLVQGEERSNSIVEGIGNELSTLPAEALISGADLNLSDISSPAESILQVRPSIFGGGVKLPSATRVLIAEDNPVNAKLAQRIIQKLGYLPEIAWNGREAVQMHTAHPYDIILMDCHMPELDGYQATEEIRRWDGPSRHTTIVAMTADVMPTNRSRCMESGMDDFVGKPIQLQTINNVLTRVQMPTTPTSGIIETPCSTTAPVGGG